MLSDMVDLLVRVHLEIQSSVVFSTDLSETRNPL